MIDPELNNWWSNKRLTHLWYKEPSLIGAGVSMQVLSKAFDGNEYTWFSKVYGEFNDNLILIAMENLATDRFNRIRYSDHEKDQRFFGQYLKNEYMITDEITSELGLTTSNQGFEISYMDKFSFYIYSHDNCFVSIEPISSELLAGVIKVVLAQHSYYLGNEIQWNGIESQLVDMIKSNKEIHIQSDPHKQCLWIPQVETNKSWFWKSFRQGTIIIDGTKASFRK